jgi:hypothetical protein
MRSQTWLKYVANLTKLSIVIWALLLFICLGCQTKNAENQVTGHLILNPNTADKPLSDKGLPQIVFDKTKHEFGLIIQGEMVEYVFRFKNVGESELIINNVSTSCGCTAPKFPKEPIAPGKEGEIEVVFNSENRTGQQVKTITVWSNCQPNQTELQITAQIVVPPKNN